MVYLITYDLDRPGQSYHPLIDALQQAGAVRILMSAWLLSSNEGYVAVRDHYSRILDANDRLWVSAVHGDWAFWNVMNPDAAKRLLPP